MTPIEAMMIPGTTKLRPQYSLTKYPAITEPRMFPTDVCEFQIPMINPRLEKKHTILFHKKRIRFENTPRRSPTIHHMVSNVFSFIHYWQP